MSSNVNSNAGLHGKVKNDFFGTRKAGSTGASSDDQTDSNSNPISGRVNKEAGSDKEASKVARLVANFKLDNQLVQQPLRWSNISPQGKPTDGFSQREEFEKRRPSLPSCFPKEEQLGTMQHQTSEPLLGKMNQNRALKLDDPLATSVLNNLELLEGLGKCLDKEYKYRGGKKCWKHLAQHFEVEAKIYEDFTCSQERSPTEDLFEFLKTRKPKEFTIGKLKNKLSSINRQDVQDVILELDDETQVGSLFDSHPQVIGEMTFLLDKEEKPGKRNWKHLADMFGVARSESQNFGESIDENPTKYLLEYLNGSTIPRLTIGEVKLHLKNLKMEDVLEVLAQSKTVNNSPLEDLWEELEIAASVCNLLNKKHTSRMRCWRLLGNKLGVTKDMLDQFSKEGEMISPTEVLIRHLGATDPSLIMAHLIWALEVIGRSDAVSVVEVCFPDGHISNFLESERAKFGDSQQQITPSSYETVI